ncbi:MAG: Ig-like domain-containing protein, partial [Marinobacter sp.]|uniref:Ig-like domain-containing protein n=1 Tax=Marinobacter sp. TaxID=50741 RepID=UPI00299EE236
MLKKTLISLAVASSVGLTGCLGGDSVGKNANPQYNINNPEIDGKTWPIFNPVTSELPIPNDLIFDSVAKDGTFRVADTSPPVTTALNSLSGASTVAPAVVRFNGQIDPATVAANQTVFLIELSYASGDPVQALNISEPPTLELAVTGPAGLPKFRADVETLDGTSAIRILPLEPLDPRKRYVVAVTKGIQDINGEAIIQSPSYNNLTDETQPLGSSGLAPVRTLINKLWEPISAAYFGAVGAELSADDIALTYSFTTSNDEKVLQYIAEPAAWFSDQIETLIKVSVARSAITGGANSYDAVKTTVDGAFGNTQTFAANLPDLFGSGKPCEGTSGQIAVTCAGVALATNFSPLLPNQSARSSADISLDSSSIKPVPLLSAVTSGILTAFGASNTAVTAAQGTVSLPYYLGTSGASLVQDSWVADDALAQQLNQAFADAGLAIPQADPSVSTAVNYIFPFPKRQAVVDVPMLALYPSSGTINGVVLYQHGITTDRSAALTFGTALATQGYAVIAIDQPLHGVAPFTAAEQEALADRLLAGAGLEVNETNRTALINGQLSLGLLAQLRSGGCTLSSDDATAIQEVIGSACGAEAATSMAGLVSIENTVANAGSTIPGLAPKIGNERHFGFYAAQPGVPAPLDYENGVGDSGSLFINLTGFLTSRDNNRQSAVDQMNLQASLSGLNLPTVTSNVVSIVDSTPVYFVGHSLGTITGTPYIAAVNANQTSALDSTVAANDINAASMLTPGGGIVRLLENSPSFAPRILLGLQQAAGLEQGDANLETYFNVFQAALDSADPINFVGNLNTIGTSVLLSEVQGDTVIPNAADEAVWGIPALNGTFNAEVNG